MEPRDDDTDRPAHDAPDAPTPAPDAPTPAPGASTPPAAARGFSTRELEAVIRRAVELQAGDAGRGDEGVSEAEVVRIGRELGLEPATVRRAMAEVRLGPAEEHGALVHVIGSRTVRASRTLRRPAATTASLLERYLRETELMVPQRRFPDRTRYVRDSSLAAGLTRFARGFSRAQKPLDLNEIEAGVHALDAGSCLVEVSTDLAGTRGGLVAGVLGGGGAAAAGWGVAAWATAIPDPLMLLGVPVLAGAWWAMRAIYRAVHRSAQDKLESLLDRLEHGDLG